MAKWKFKLGEPGDCGELEIIAKSEADARRKARAVWNGKLTLVSPRKAEAGS